MKNLKVLVLGVLVIIGCVWLLNLQDKTEYNKAIERCGNAENIIKAYTNQGDKYFICATEK